MPDQRGQLLRAAVGFAGCSMPSYDRALWALRTWLDSWAGIGRVAVGMARQGFDRQLTQSPFRLSTVPGHTGPACADIPSGSRFSPPTTPVGPSGDRSEDLPGATPDPGGGCLG